MKIKPRIKINTNPSRITKIGEYVYHNGNLLLACDRSRFILSGE